MPPPLIGGGIKRWSCLSVCLSVCLPVEYIVLKSRTERPRKTKISTEVAHVTRDSDTTFTVKRSKVKVISSFGWLFKSLHNLYWRHHILRRRPERAAACRPWGGGIVWRPPAYSLLSETLLSTGDVLRVIACRDIAWRLGLRWGRQWSVEDRRWFAKKLPLAGFDEEVVRPADSRTSALVVAEDSQVQGSCQRPGAVPRGGGTHTAVANFRECSFTVSSAVYFVL